MTGGPSGCRGLGGDMSAQETVDYTLTVTRDGSIEVRVQGAFGGVTVRLGADDSARVAETVLHNRGRQVTEKSGGER